MKANDPVISEKTQRELAAGVLKQVAQALRRFHGATSRVVRELYYDAYSWLMSEDDSWPFSFPNVCQLLNRAPEELRQELLDDLSFHAVLAEAERTLHFIAEQYFSPNLTVENCALLSGQKIKIRSSHSAKHAVAS